ncbi:MAG: DUF1566 domain-containing protein [Desulfoarculaceae bacterium]|nr:DUF1566 domain-containing protein [Desulfoarculaceae bacterium]
MEKRTGRVTQLVKADGCSLRPLWRVVPLVVFLLAPGMAWAADWSPLQDTGQEKCYDTVGDEMGCPEVGQPLYGQDGHYQGTPPAYLDNGNQTVTDQNSGLVWMQSDDGIPRIWQDAGDYCNGLVFAGQSDWRLPTRFELDSIIDYGRSYPAINPVFTCRSSFYWSAVPYAGDPVYAWGIFFNDGGDHWLDKINKYYVRCVRAGL